MTPAERQWMEADVELRLRYKIRSENEGMIRFLEALRASLASQDRATLATPEARSGLRHSESVPDAGQSRAHSVFEAVANVSIGYLVAITAQILIFPLFGIQIQTESHLAIGALFTLVSLGRSYVLRRIFNRWQA